MSEDGESGPTRPEDDRRKRFQRLGEQLTGLLDPEAALRRGQGIVSGVSRATKDELMRIVGAEVRSFLDKIDIVDLAQQVVAGLEVDVRMQMKFARSGSVPAPEAQPPAETQKPDEKASADAARRSAKKDGNGTAR